MISRIRQDIPCCRIQLGGVCQQCVCIFSVILVFVRDIHQIVKKDRSACKRCSYRRIRVNLLIDNSHMKRACLCTCHCRRICAKVGLVDLITRAWIFDFWVRTYTTQRVWAWNTQCEAFQVAVPKVSLSISTSPTYSSQYKLQPIWLCSLLTWTNSVDAEGCAFISQSVAWDDWFRTLLLATWQQKQRRTHFTWSRKYFVWFANW